MDINFIALAVSSIIPLLIGIVWYHPKFGGTTWMREAEISEEKMRNWNKLLIISNTIILGLFLSLGLYSMVIHQPHIYSAVMSDPSIKDPNSELSLWLQNFMSQYGQNFRTFKHGAFHGLVGSFLIALPIITINALLERKSFKYIMINWMFWAVCMIIMGGIISAYA